MPDQPGFVYVRVTSRTISQAEGTDHLYNVALTLSNHGLSGGGGGGAPGPGTFPNPPATQPAIVQWKAADVGSGPATITLDDDPGEGDVFVVWQTQRSGAGSNQPSTTPPTDWTIHPDGNRAVGPDGTRMIYRTVAAGESSTVTVTGSGEAGGHVTIVELAGVTTTPDAHNEAVGPGGSPVVTPYPMDAGTLAPSSGSPAILIAGLAADVSDGGGYGVDPGAGWTTMEYALPGSLHPLHWLGYRIVESTTGTYPTTQSLLGTFPSPIGLAGLGNYGGQALAFLGASPADFPPAPGQWVYDETPTPAPGGGNTTFSTLFPFSDGSLRVWVDLVEQTAAITSYNGATGSFTLSFDPRSFESITVSYQGR